MPCAGPTDRWDEESQALKEPWISVADRQFNFREPIKGEFSRCISYRYYHSKPRLSASHILPTAHNRMHFGLSRITPFMPGKSHRPRSPARTDHHDPKGWIQTTGNPGWCPRLFESVLSAIE